MDGSTGEGGEEIKKKKSCTDLHWQQQTLRERDPLPRRLHEYEIPIHKIDSRKKKIGRKRSKSRYRDVAEIYTCVEYTHTHIFTFST